VVSLGGFTIQFLRLWRDSLPEEQQEQVKLIATCSKKNAEYVKSLGATHVVDYTSEDIVKRKHELTDNRGVDVFIDNVGFENRSVGLESLDYEVQLILPVKSGENIGVGAKLSLCILFSFLRILSQRIMRKWINLELLVIKS